MLFGGSFSPALSSTCRGVDGSVDSSGSSRAYVGPVVATVTKIAAAAVFSGVRLIEQVYRLVFEFVCSFRIEMRSRQASSYIMVRLLPNSVKEM